MATKSPGSANCDRNGTRLAADGRVDETRVNMEKTITTIEKNKREEIRIALTAYQGHDLCDVRVFAEPYAGDEWISTKKGISLSVAKLPALIEGLQVAEREARQAGLLTSSTPGAETATEPDLSPKGAAWGDSL